MIEIMWRWLEYLKSNEEEHKGCLLRILDEFMWDERESLKILEHLRPMLVEASCYICGKEGH